MTRVVHVHRIRGIGGSERHLLTLLPALASEGVEPVFLGLDDPAGVLDPFYGELGVESVRLVCPRDLDPGLLRQVRRELKRLRPDVVHTHLVHGDVYGGLAAGGVPVVSTKHNDDPFRRGPFRYVERGLTRRAARVIAITTALRRFCVDEVGLPAAKVEVVHYGLDDLPRPWDESPEVHAAGRRTGAALRRAAHGAEGRGRGGSGAGAGARDRAAGGAGRARRGAGAAPPAGEKASTWRAGSATSHRGTAGRSCSSTRRAGRGSAWRCWRRCWPRSRWSRRG